MGVMFVAEQKDKSFVVMNTTWLGFVIELIAPLQTVNMLLCEKKRVSSFFQSLTL